MNEEIIESCCKSMFDLGAVRTSIDQPFVWSSGLKAPLYCDHRLIISDLIIRNKIIFAMEEIIKFNYSNIEVIAGVSTAGVPYAAWLSDLLKLPLIYVRPKAKGHGHMNFIEGNLKYDQNVLIIEDVLTTGGSAIHTAEQIRKSGGNVKNVLAIFDYKFEILIKNMDNSNLEFSSLYDFYDLMKFASIKNKIPINEIDQLEQFIKSPYSFYE